MSDFLSNLVARNFSPMAVVKPRLLSLFESPSSNLVPEVGNVDRSFESTSNPQSTDRAGLQDSINSETRHDAFKQSTSFKTTSPTRISNRRAESAPLQSNIDEESANATSPETARSFSPVHNSARSNDSPNSQSFEIENSAPDTIGGIRVSVNREATDSSVNQLPAIAQSERPQSAAGNQSTNSLVREQSFDASRKTVMPRVNKPATGQYTSSNHSPVVNSRQSEQTIHVTIGRIDVRAILPTGKEKPRSTTSRDVPQLSLSDYLKQQGQVKR